MSTLEFILHDDERAKAYFAPTRDNGMLRDLRDSKKYGGMVPLTEEDEQNLTAALTFTSLTQKTQERVIQSLGKIYMDSLTMLV